MQLRKQHWKRVRVICPCIKCGKEHESKQCVTKRGAKRETPELTAFVGRW